MGDVTKLGPKEQETAGYQAGSLLVGSRPDEMCFPLREEEFHVLREGEISTARSSRDVCIGVCATAIAGLIGVVSTVDWETAWKPEHRGWFLFWLAALWVLVSGSAVGVWIHHSRLRRAREDSPYSRLTKRVTDWFNVQRLGADQALTVRDYSLAVVTARYGANQGWIDVAALLRTRIRDGKLRIPVTNSDLGSDPAPNVVKTLEVEYSYGGRPYRRIVPEGQELSIPETH